MPTDQMFFSTVAANTLSELLTALGYEFTLDINCDEEGNELAFMISSPDARYLIGTDGDRLDDLQYLVNRIVQEKWDKGRKPGDGDAPRIRVDCDRYRERAEALLLRRARSRAERVQKTGKPLLMEPLNAYQRRLVHNALAEMEGIATESEQTESRFKRITISRRA